MIALVFNKKYTKLLWIPSLLLVLFGCAKNKFSLHDMELAKLYFDRGQYTKAYPKLSQFADQGNGEALYLLGYMHYYGEGVDSDPDLAYEYFQKAAKQDHPLAKAALNTLSKQEKSVKSEYINNSKDIGYEFKENNDTVPAAAIQTPAVIQTPKVKHHTNIDSIDENYFTIQLVGLGSEQSIIKLFRELKLGKQYKYYQTSHQGKSWFVLIVGKYKTLREANTGITKLPHKFKNWSPFATSFKTVVARIQS